MGLAHLRNSFGGTSLIQPVSRFLVALPPVLDLLLCAKHVFIAAIRLKVSMMLGCSQMRALSECSNCRSRVGCPDTNRSSA
jgi:hypothetical protein